MKRISRNWTEYNESLSQEPDAQIEDTEWAAPLKSLIPGKIDAILEVGCSNGRYLTNLDRVVHAKELVGLDLVSCKTPEKMHFVQGDGMRLPFKDGAFDFVYSMGVLEHFKRDDRETLIKEQSRVLKSGGIVMILMPNCTLGSLRFAKTKTLDLFREFHHMAYTPSQIRDELRRNGIEVLVERFMGSSVHIGKLNLSAPARPTRYRVFSDEYVIMGKRMGGA